MKRKVLVIGAGLAGTAAAFEAARAGAEVTLASRLAGASALATGAVDDVPWDELERAARLAGAPLVARPLERELVAFVEALGLHVLARDDEPLARVATLSGLVRVARGRDRALLDLAQCAARAELRGGGVVAIPRARRAGWDADALARALSADPYADARDLRFEAIDATVLMRDQEARFGDADFASLHDDPARLAWLGARLEAALARALERRPRPIVGLLLGPWLGATEPRAEALAQALGFPVGEALGAPGGAPGLRFEAARAALLRASGVRAETTRVAALRVDSTRGTAMRVAATSEPRAGVRADLGAFDAAVVAVGGVAGGGVAYVPPEVLAGQDLPSATRPAFELSVALDVGANVVVSPEPARVDAMTVASSMHGPVLDALAWPDQSRRGALEDAGVWGRGELGLELSAKPGVYAAGDCVARRPRTALEAVRTGLAAGRLAARG